MIESQCSGSHEQEFLLTAQFDSVRCTIETISNLRGEKAADLIAKYLFLRSRSLKTNSNPDNVTGVVDEFNEITQALTDYWAGDVRGIKRYSLQLSGQLICVFGESHPNGWFGQKLKNIALAVGG